MQGRVIFATENADKMKEIQMILKDTGLEVLPMKDAGIFIEIEEKGQSYEENAMIKAEAVASAIRRGRDRAKKDSPDEKLSGGTAAQGKDMRKAEGLLDIVMADDSGLEIDYLGREPGIYSARYLGRDTPYSVKNQNLLDRLKGVPEELRTARFVCAVAAVLPDGRKLTARASIEGRIGYEERGSHGFGYDPIFYVPQFHKTTAELTEEEKNQVSHRGKALRLMKEELKRYAYIDCE